MKKYLMLAALFLAGSVCANTEETSASVTQPANQEEVVTEKEVKKSIEALAALINEMANEEKKENAEALNKENSPKAAEVATK